MIDFFNVSLEYNRKQILKDINLHIDKGEFVYLIGSSGAGKTSLLKLVYLEKFPSEGSMVIAEFDSLKIKKRHIHKLRRKLGIVFQDFKLFQDRSVFENIAFVLKVTGTKRKDIVRKVTKILDQVGLSGKADKKPRELSGGEQQRVAIARAIVNEPYILLADEPTGNLDPSVSEEIIQLLHKINDMGTAVLMTTHDYDLIKRFPKRVVEIKDGKAVPGD
jgi:cell division transport system ATP-binding protein